MKRKLSHKQELAIRLCHHDFKGLSQKQAAEEMGISIQAVSALLKSVKKIAPQLFPILTKEQVAVKRLAIDAGESREEVAEALGISVGRVKEILHQLTQKNIAYIPTHVVAYSPHMDSQIREKF